MKKFIGIAAGLGALALTAAFVPALAQQAPAAAQAPDAHAIYLERCADCHDVNEAEDRTPPKAQLALMGPDPIIESLTRGIMRPMAEGLSTAEIRSLAVYLTGKQPLPDLPPGPDANLCAAQTPIAPAAGDWNGWGVNERNTRYQPNPGFTRAQVPQLKTKWTFSYPGKKNGQATIVGDRIFFTTNAGKLYSLNADTGCVYWRKDMDNASRTSPIVARNTRSPSGWAVYYGDDSLKLYAADAMTGNVFWSRQIDQHPRGVMTATPVLHNGVLYVSTSSMEETVTRETAYVCCTFRGSVSAVDAATGEVKWRTFAIPEAPRVHRTAGDKNLLGPAGAAIWSTPTVDAKLGRIYFATGDGYTDVETNRTDAVIALDMRTGRVVWSLQVTENDQFLVGCPASGVANRPANCPLEVGPDHDFGQSPILVDLPDGKRMLVIGQKSGIAYGLDPDRGGNMVWKTRVGSGGVLGGIQWGSAVDTAGRMFVAVADTIPNGVDEAGNRIPARPGLYALDVATGRIAWSRPTPRAACSLRGNCNPSHSQAVSAMPGVVFSGTLDAKFRAYDAETGNTLWEFDTGLPVTSANGLTDQIGGALDGAGPTIGRGTVFLHAGYSGYGGGANGNNVLFAFTPDGR